MIIEPQSDYLLLTEILPGTEESGIIIPEYADIERTLPGKVEAKGPAVTMAVNDGDLVLFKRHLFDEVVYNRQKYLFGKESNVLAILRDN